jgi:hypothetical protein
LASRIVKGFWSRSWCEITCILGIDLCADFTERQVDVAVVEATYKDYNRANNVLLSIALRK